MKKIFNFQNIKKLIYIFQPDFQAEYSSNDFLCSLEKN